VLTYFTARNAAKYEEDVVEWNGTEEIEEEPRSNVMLGDQLRVDDHLKKTISLTFYEQLLHAKIPKAQKYSQANSLFLHFCDLS